jgi:MoxR-like ATPase
LKSEIVQQIAQELNWHLIDLRLTRMDSTDLTGLPYLHEATKKTIYYLPEFYPTEEMIKSWSKDGCIIFLDELSSCEPRLQVSAYQLVLERRINDYKVPDNVMIIAAGNRIEDNCIAYDLTAAISDRFIHFNAISSLESWMKWEKKRAEAGRPIVAEVKAFLQTSPQFLDEGFAAMGVNSDDKINVSPRKLIAA